MDLYDTKAHLKPDTIHLKSFRFFLPSLFLSFSSVILMPSLNPIKTCMYRYDPDPQKCLKLVFLHIPLRAPRPHHIVPHPHKSSPSTLQPSPVLNPDLHTLRSTEDQPEYSTSHFQVLR